VYIKRLVMILFSDSLRPIGLTPDSGHGGGNKALVVGIDLEERAQRVALAVDTRHGLELPRRLHKALEPHLAGEIAT
jgi:hypothetical protein